MDICSVIYEDWQMQCCGTPFKVGETVEWLATKWTPAYTALESLLMQFSIEKISYCYEAHGSEHDELFVISGIVSKIIAIRSAIEPDPNNSKINISVPKIALPVNHADGSDEDVDGFKLDFYVITLENVAIRSADPTDVSFK